jgi:hypothetical protein
MASILRAGIRTTLHCSPTPAILLPMPQDPVEEWRRLTALYSEMGDIEIEELADQINDLTPAAQDVLRDELKKRGIASGPAASAPSPDHDGEIHWEKEQDNAAEGDSSEEGASRDYTWKVALCRCESLDEAAARSEMLRRARIDSWIQHSGTRFIVPWLETGVGDFQINVAADQLDRAQTIAARPIPQDILDELKEQAAIAEFELPTCPKCGAADPILESVEPSNNWLCESCENTWSDPIPENSPQ